MTVSFRTTNNNFQTPQKSVKYDKYLPVKSAVVNTVIWTGFGLGFDFLVMNKLLKWKSSPKQSLLINGIFGLIIGIYTFFKTKRMQEEDNIKNTDDLIRNFTNKNS